MSIEDDSKKAPLPVRTVEALVRDLCKLVLTETETTEFKDVTSYIDSLSAEEIRILNDDFDETRKECIEEIVTGSVAQYIRQFLVPKLSESPFEFDSGGAYERYQKRFHDTYCARTGAAVTPPVFGFVFRQIKRASNEYAMVESLYKIRMAQFQEVLKEETDKIAKDMAHKHVEDKVRTAVDEALLEASREAREHAEMAKNNAQTASEQAKKASERAKKAATQAKQAVDQQIMRISSRVSETSVTILGIFAGIVLTVVAGLFYSSSVISNVNNADLFKLISIGSLIGFVAINLMAYGN